MNDEKTGLRARWRTMTRRRADASDEPVAADDPTRSFWRGRAGLPATDAHRRSGRLPARIRRPLGVECPACHGFGCSDCAGSGLG